jgi:predicted membrane protein
MKWGGYSQKAGEKLTKKLTEKIGTKGIYVLITLASLALLIGASDKWAW